MITVISAYYCNVHSVHTSLEETAKRIFLYTSLLSVVVVVVVVSCCLLSLVSPVTVASGS